MESDITPILQAMAAATFLSTLSAWRATITNHTLQICHNNFYPRSPHGERPDWQLTPIQNAEISIHALRMESDNIYDYLQEMLDSISIHALRMESDCCNAVNVL